MCLTAHSLKAQSVIPVPLKMEQGTGSFLLSEKTKLYTNLQGGEAQLLENCLQTLPVHLKKGKKKDTQNVLSLLITEKSGQLPTPESYTLSVTPERIQIQATSGAGLFYGIQTLLQLSVSSDTGVITVSAVEVQDTPRFAYRGLMLDVSRHFFTKEFVKKQIDALAFYKINRLHLHLTDAAGWRIEIKKYPLLTEFAAWRTDANWKKWWNAPDGRRYCEQSDPRACGGYYTRDYLEVLGKNGNANGLREFGVTAGFGFPVPSFRTIVNLGFEFKHRAANPDPLIKENYFNITIGVNFNEMWFRQSKIY